MQKSEVKTLFVVEPSELTNLFTYLASQTDVTNREKVEREIQNFLSFKVEQAETDMEIA